MKSAVSGKDGSATSIQFVLPVDDEHKATVLPIHRFAQPHMAAFHLSWVAFFCAFVATFAPSALIPIIRQDLGLTKTDIGNAAIASVCGAICARILMGNFVDAFGPRYGFAGILLLTCPATFCMALVTDSTGFIIVRMCIGFALATFVCNQFWCTQMFNTKIVGTANAVSAGWGNMGGGAALILMPYVVVGFEEVFPTFIAWRYAFIVPAAMELFLGMAVLLFGQDVPDGQYWDLVQKSEKKKDGGWGSYKAAILNYRTWICALNYGYCFGVELTVDNVLTAYFFDQFGLSLEMSGLIAALFGLMNIFTRATGGILSDIAGKYWGMRGRLWTLYIIQSLGGVFCVVLGLVAYNLTATIVVVIIFSVFCQQACGASFGVVPFVSKRSTGLVYGIVGAGGNGGAALTQAIFFTYTSWTVYQGFVWMGVMTIGMSTLYFLTYFPMWGGMFCPAKKGVSEEDYYLGEYTAEEQAAGLASASLKFAMSSRSNRGWAKAGMEATTTVQADAASLNKSIVV